MLALLPPCLRLRVRARGRRHLTPEGLYHLNFVRGEALRAGGLGEVRFDGVEGFVRELGVEGGGGEEVRDCEAVGWEGGGGEDCVCVWCFAFNAGCVCRFLSGSGCICIRPRITPVARLELLLRERGQREPALLCCRGRCWL